MKLINRIIALALWAVMLLSFFGCTPPDSEEVSTPDRTETEAPIETEKQEETTAPETEVTTAAPTESTNTEAIVEESGCSGIISAASVTLVLLCLPVFLNRKKYES